MKARVVKTFSLDGESVIFRYPQFSDWSDMLKKVNSLVKEKAFISTQRRETAKKSRQWIRQILKSVEEKRSVTLMVEIRGHVVGGGSIWMAKDEDGVGFLGISIRSIMPDTHEKLWGRGIGKKLIYTLMHEAKIVLGTKVVKLGAFLINHNAVALYRKCGFKETHRVRREKIHYGVMRDRIYMKRRLR